MILTVTKYQPTLFQPLVYVRECVQHFKFLTYHNEGGGCFIILILQLIPETQKEKKQSES